MYRFEHKEYLWGLLSALILLIVWMIFIFKTRSWREKLSRYPSLLSEIMPYFSIVKISIKGILRILAFCLLVLALANLQTGIRLKEEKRAGADLMICLDVSNSMLAQDFMPNRLGFAKYSIERLLQNLSGDRIGLVVFAGDAWLQLPITTDYGAALMFLRAIEPGMIPVQGTNLSAALSKASESFGQEIGKNKAIILISDGEDHEQGAVEKAKELTEKGIQIHCIGIGSEQGVPIPHIENGKILGYKKDAQGQTVITRLNTSLLKEIASVSGGLFVQASPKNMGLDIILKKINSLEKKETGTQVFYDYESQYHWFLWAALILLLSDILLTDRKFLWLKKWYENWNL